jgi:hypothetical protein
MKISIILNLISVMVLFFAVMNLIQYQKSKNAKYEFKMFHERSNWDLNNKLSALQDKGWEIAGPITVENRDQHFVLIPMKRKLK